MHLTLSTWLLVVGSWATNVRLKDDTDYECLKDVECIKRYFKVLILFYGFVQEITRYV